VRFVRKKRRADGSLVYQVVESRREDGKVRRRVLVSLSHEVTIEARLAVVRKNASDPGTDATWRLRWEALAAVRQATGLP
jgi:hypothetical protein